MSERLPGYSKVKYSADEIALKVDIAIENEEKFCEDIGKLKDKVGSNVGFLIKTLRE